MSSVVLREAFSKMKNNLDDVIRVILASASGPRFEKRQCVFQSGGTVGGCGCLPGTEDLMKNAFMSH